MVLCALLLLDTPARIQVNVDNLERQALIVAPSQTTTAKPPVLFMFHGHGGSADRCFNRFHFEKAWPDAVVVYPDGLPITLGDPTKNGKGWVLDCNEQNRDIKLFDVLREKVVKDFHGDPKRVFACGFSNGGMFMYTLWTMRPHQLAAVCPSGACIATDDTHLLEPLPCFVTVSGNDEIVPTQYQSQGVDAVKKVDRSQGSGRPYGDHGEYFRGQKPVVVWNYDGGHEFPFECYPSLIKFFKEAAG